MSTDETKIRQKLIAKKQELERLSDGAQERRKPVQLDQQSVGRLSRMDSLQVQAMDLAQEKARRKMIVRIDAALQRLDDGDWGYCVTCGNDISPQRLELDPSTPLCIACAR